MSYKIQKSGKKASGKKFICSNCGKHFSTLRAQQLHRMAEHSKDYYQCQKCDENFCNKAGFIKHLDQVHGEIRPSCQECGVILATAIHLKKHNNEFHGSFPCSHPKCTRKLDTLERLNKHVAKHSIQFACTLCDKWFIDPAGLRLHTERIHSDNNCTCTVEGCNVKFKHPKDLRAHEVQYHHVKFHENNTCTICGHYFKGNKRSLVTHMKTTHWLETFKKQFGKAKKDGEDEEELLIAPPKLSVKGHD